MKIYKWVPVTASEPCQVYRL